MTDHSIFGGELKLPPPEESPLAARTPFWQGQSFVLTLGVQFSYYLHPSMNDGMAIKWPIGSVVHQTIASTSIWKNLDFEGRNNGRIVRPTDTPTSSASITTTDMGVLGFPAMDTYNEVTFLGANTSGEYILFIDALVTGLRYTPQHFIRTVAVANLTVDNHEAWSRTYITSGQWPEEKFTDEHKIFLKRAE